MPHKSSSVDIFDLLSGSEEKARKTKLEKEEAAKKQREELLAPTKVKDLFPKGSITINKYTCTGVQCKLCVKACPTNALYWTSQGVGITEELCVHCEACVLSCMVPDCIKITRKREGSPDEHFSKARDVLVLNDKICGKKRFLRVQEVFPSSEEYCKRYGFSK